MDGYELFGLVMDKNKVSELGRRLSGWDRGIYVYIPEWTDRPVILTKPALHPGFHLAWENLSFSSRRDQTGAALNEERVIPSFDVPPRSM